MEISAEQVRELRERTGAGIMDCKKALKESKGDLGDAMTYLRQKGLAAAQKKAGRVANEGLVYAYIHAGGKVGVLLEMNCETDFVAKTDDFRSLTKDVAMHIAAMNPLYVRKEDVPEDVVGREKEIYRAQAKESGKPEKVIDRIAEGKLEKFFKEVCLLEQSFVKNPDVTIGGVVTEAISKLGENIQVGRFARFKVGEGASA
jgi:elongation factor Ts